MGMNSVEIQAKRLLVDQWSNVVTQLGRLNLPDTRPIDGHQIFALIDYPKVDGQLAFTVNPVTFNVPERADGSADMYITVKGRIYLDEAAVRTSRNLMTVSFGTEVAYFRMRQGKLNHVYGAHYDFSLNEIGHPIFHAQMKSFVDRGKLVSDTFTLDCESEDHIANILRTVRVPTAQMDFFALVLQICADHLMSKNSSAEQREAFEDLRKASYSIQGAGHLWAQLAVAPPCMRTQHWYR
jgi:hypothetical protein